MGENTIKIVDSAKHVPMKVRNMAEYAYETVPLYIELAKEDEVIHCDSIYQISFTY